MGGNTFMITGKGSNADQAFRQVTEQDRYENGHSYSGGIGMKSDFVRIATVDSFDAAYDMAYQLIDAGDPRIDDKWGPAGCIEVVLPTTVAAPKVREGSTAALVWGALADGAERTAKQLAEATGKSPVTVNRYAGKLVASGHLVKNGRTYRAATRQGAATTGERSFVFFGLASS